MTTTRRLLLAAAIGFAALALVLHARQSRGPSIVADPVRTPGVLNGAVTQATVRSTVCRHGWTRTIRPPIPTRSSGGRCARTASTGRRRRTRRTT